MEIKNSGYNFGSVAIDTAITLDTKTEIGTAEDFNKVAALADALGVTNMDRRVTSDYNARGEFTNNWYKFDAGYFNDFNENLAVFILN